jgi:hypothetical protein
METTKEFSQFWELGLTGIAATNRLSATGDQAIFDPSILATAITG